MQGRKTKDFTQGNILKQLIGLAIPIMGTSFLQMAYSFTDMAWLGRLSTKDVAAVGVVSVFLWIANSISLLCKSGAEVTISNSIGRSDPIQKTRNIASHNTTISIILGIFLSILYGLFIPDLLNLYDLDSSVYKISERYFSITNIGIPFIFVSTSIFGIYNASGHSLIPFKTLGIGLVSNIILDPIFIFTFSLGTIGSAIATLISEILVVIAFVIQLNRDNLFGGFSFFTILRKQVLLDILKIGTPVASLNVLFAIVTVYLGRLASINGGHIAVATLTTGGQLEALTWNTSQGITTALCSFVGQNYGARLYKRIKKSFYIALRCTLIIGLLGSYIFIFKGDDLFYLIIPDHDTSISGGQYLFISGLSQVFMMLEITSQGLLYGLRRSIAPAVISITGNYLRIPLSLFLVSSFYLGACGIWWAISITATIKGILLFSYALYIVNKLK